MINQYYGQTLPAITSYVNAGNSMTVAALLATFPASESYKGQYARVSDLYGSVDEILRCRFDGVNYRWVPQRESYTGTSAVSQGTIPIVSLVTPPTLRLQAATLTNNVSVNPSSLNSYIGERRRIIAPSALPVSAYIIQVMGLVGSNVSLLAGKTIDIEYGADGWFQSA